MIVEPSPRNSNHAFNEIPSHVPDALRPLILSAEQVLGKYAHGSTLPDNELQNLKDTPLRAARGWAELVQNFKPVPDESMLLHFVQPHHIMEARIKKILATGFPGLPDTTSTLITQGPIKVDMLCPHHLMWVRAEVFVSYLPSYNGTLLGLSKLARLAIVLGQRPVLQEQYTQELAMCLNHPEGHYHLPGIKSDGSAVQVVARHECMSCRGVRSNALTHTAALRGTYATNVDVRQEFYAAVDAIRHSKIKHD